MNKEAISAFGSQYGPYGFGVVSLLIIWFVIVQPELRTNRIEYEEQKQIVSQMKAIADTMRETVSTLERVRDRSHVAQGERQ